MILAVAASLALARPAAAEIDSNDKEKKGGEDATVLVRSIERTRGEKKQVSWLGVGVEEAPEALAAQLDLKTGQGLVVTMVASNSPAFAADLHKYDVLVELDGQMLMDITQLRKLVRMHPEGDSVTLTLFRGGKKISVSTKLSQTTLESASLDENEPAGALNLDMAGLNRVNEALRTQLAPLDGKRMKVEFAHVEADERNAQVEMKDAMEEVQRALERTMKEHPGRLKVLASEDKDVSDLKDAGISLDKDASVVVTKDLNSCKSILKTDDSGVYIIVADPKKHLTVHDHDGKLLYDGEIETTDEQDKVPRDVWEKVKPMLDQLGNVIVIKPQSKTTVVGRTNS
jgi:hypothetical protein